MAKKSISLETASVLRGLTEGDLTTLTNLRSRAEYTVFKKILDRVSDMSVAQVMYFSEDDPVKLALFKANKRGGVRMLGILVELIDGAEGEINRRAKKEGSKK